MRPSFGVTVSWASLSIAKTYAAAFVDLTNAFPSVDQATLWAKLASFGVAGPMVDWLRMLYSRMTYVVRFGGEYAESFRAHAGILIGDPASPMLWNLYLSDFLVNEHPDDVLLDGLHTSHLEQADDIVLFSLSPEGLQRKLDQLTRWCNLNFVRINTSKTKCMAFGALPVRWPPLSVGGTALSFVKEYCYVGITFASTCRFRFARHMCVKHEKARKKGNAVLSLESYSGSIPVWAGRMLYMAHLDPHLTSGADVILDVDRQSLMPLVNIQRTFLRRLLGLNPRSMVAVLSSETGIWPLRYRRAQLALRYLRYLSAPGAPAMVSHALQEARDLALNGAASWWSDLWHALRALPVPVCFNINELPSPTMADRLLHELGESLNVHMHQELESSRLPLLHGRTEWCKRSRKLIKRPLAFREYLRLENATHRKALTRLLLADHPFAVEQLRRFCPRRRVVHELRTCRFCEAPGSVEDEIHVLLDCFDPRLVAIREKYMSTLYSMGRVVLAMRRERTSRDFLMGLLGRPALLPTLSAFVAEVFALCEEVPMINVPLEEAALDAPLPRWFVLT